MVQTKKHTPIIAEAVVEVQLSRDKVAFPVLEVASKDVAFVDANVLSTHGKRHCGRVDGGRLTVEFLYDEESEFVKVGRREVELGWRGL